MIKKSHFKLPKNVQEILGWYGTVAILGAYALVSFGVTDADTLLYQVLNLTGALGIVVISFAKGATQPGVLNVIWSVIAVVAIIGILI